MSELVLAPFSHILVLLEHSYGLSLHCVNQTDGELIVGALAFEGVQEGLGLLFQILNVDFLGVYISALSSVQKLIFGQELLEELDRPESVAVLKILIGAALLYFDILSIEVHLHAVADIGKLHGEVLYLCVVASEAEDHIAGLTVTKARHLKLPREISIVVKFGNKGLIVQVHADLEAVSSSGKSVADCIDEHSSNRSRILDVPNHAVEFFRN